MCGQWTQESGPAGVYGRRSDRLTLVEFNCPIVSITYQSPQKQNLAKKMGLLTEIPVGLCSGPKVYYDVKRSCKPYRSMDAI